MLIIPLLFKNKTSNPKKDLNLDLTNNDIKKIDNTLDKEKLMSDIFDIYKKVEVAKSKFNYDILKELLTDNLYQEELNKLKELKENKQKLVATNIKLQEVRILSIQKENGIDNINAYLHVSRYDYVINNKKEIIRGTDKTEYQIEYKITLEKSTDKYLKIKKKECTGKWIKNK